MRVDSKLVRSCHSKERKEWWWKKRRERQAIPEILPFYSARLELTFQHFLRVVETTSAKPNEQKVKISAEIYI